MRLGIAFVVFLSLIAAMPASATVVTLQQNVSGYTGFGVAHINANAPNDNNGMQDYEALSASQVGFILIKFDGMGIPPGSTINSATLSIYAATWDAVNQPCQTYSLLKPWNSGSTVFHPANPGEVTWNSAQHGALAWETPGAYGATDAAPAVDPTRTWFGNVWAWIPHNVKASLQEQANSGNFYGWILRFTDPNNKFGAARGVDTLWPKLTVDYTPPANMVQISNVSCAFSGTTATVTWTTNVASSSIVEYGATMSYGTTVTGPDGVTEHSVSIPGFAPNTPVIHYKVKSAASGYATGETGDNMMPTMYIYPESIFVVPAAPDSVKIMWVCRDYNYDAGVFGSYEVFWGETSAYGSYGDHINTAGVYGWNGHDHGAILTGLKPGTTYHFKVRDRQSLNDENNAYLYAESGDLTFTTIGSDEVAANYQYETGVYEGAYDNTMNPMGPDDHWGANVYLNTHSGWDWIVKFNNLNIPAGATVKKAYLQVFGAVFGESKATLNCHGLLKDWGESGRNGVPVTDGESSWNWAMYPTTQWTVGGAKGDGTDRKATPDDSIVFTDWWSFRSWDVTASFLEQHAAGTYYGWMVERAPNDPHISSDGLVFYSKEMSMREFHPMLTVVYQPTSLGPSLGSLKDLPDEADVNLINRTATLRFLYEDPMGFYIEDSDRSAGIFVATSAIISEGRKVNVVGKMATMPTGERYTQASSVNVLSQGSLPGALGMINKPLGSPLAGAGMQNIGLLANVAGKVTAILDGFNFYIDDGSGIVADGGNAGVKVVANEAVTLNTGDYVSVIGVVSVGLDGSRAYPVLRTTGPPRVNVQYAIPQ